MGVGLYVHVPFCLARCNFCAFYLQIFREDSAQRYLKGLRQEIRLHADRGTLGGREPETIYFGGGTPTTLRPRELCGVLDELRDTFGMHPNAEVSIEAHPETVTSEGLASLVRAGFTRISFGIQSLDADELIGIGRPTAPQVPRQAVELARRAGFGDINLDVIYGLPGQTIESWLATLEEVLALEPTHLSCYALTVEERTQLARDVRKGAASAPDPDVQNAMEEAAVRRLAEAGFRRYEISNYSRPGYACRHNLLHWQGGEYLGLGPSAQSFLRGCRFGNVEGLLGYLRTLEAGRLPIAESEPLGQEQTQHEAVVFGLRLIEGVERRLVQHAMDKEGDRSLNRLMGQGLLEEHSGRIRLTDMGRRYADTVAVELL